MILTLLTNEVTEWPVATLLASILTFLIVLSYLYVNKIYKRAAITRSVFISAVASLSSAAIILARVKGSEIEIEAIFVLRGIQYAFTFYPMLYAFYRIIVRVDGEDKSLVYIGYIWMLVTLGISFAATIMVKGIDFKYDIAYAEHLYNVVSITMLSSWGFIAVILLLYIRNKKYFVVGETSAVVYMFLVLVQAITTTIILYSPLGSIDAHPAVVFILIDLTMDIAIIMAAHYGPAWMGDELEMKKANVNANSGDLEAN